MLFYDLIYILFDFSDSQSGRGWHAAPLTHKKLEVPNGTDSFYLLSINKSFGFFFKIPAEEMIRDIISTRLMNKITYSIDFGNMLISRLVRVLLNPSTSAPPPSWLDDDCFAICLVISPVTLFNILFPRLAPVNLAKK